MKEKLIYSIEEIRNYGGEVISYTIANNYKAVARVSKEEGDNAISAIKKYGRFYDYEVNVINTDCLCWTFYFEIGNDLPEPEKKCLAVYGHCRYCGSGTFVEVPRVPGTIFDYGDPDLMCKTCGRIIVESELIYERDDK